MKLEDCRAFYHFFTTSLINSIIHGTHVGLYLFTEQRSIVGIAAPTADPRVTSLIPAWSHTFV